VAIVVGSQIVSRLGPWQQKLLSTGGIVVVVLGVYVLVFGPLLARLDLRSDLMHADVLKTYPIPGWRLVLGELLAPIMILTGIIWLALLTGLCAIQVPATAPSWFQPSLRGVYASCIATLIPVLVTLQLIVPNAAAVVFPAWFQATRSVGGGIDMMGQRVIFVFGQLFVIVLALIPAVATASVLIFVTQWVIGPGLAVVFATLIVIGILLGEVWCAVWWLGERFERFDLSAEQRP